MPAQIVNLNELVPGLEGKQFTLTLNDETKTYSVPGDLDTKYVLGFLKLFEDMFAFQESAQEAAAAGDKESLVSVSAALEELTSKIKERLLEVFRIAQPDLEEFPFGQATTMFVLGEILEMVGLASTEPVPVPDPPEPRKGRKSSSRRTTTRSTKPAG